MAKAKKMLVLTGPQGAGNHLWSKIFSLHPKVYGWKTLLDNYWEAHRFAEAYRLIGPTMEQPQYNLFEREKMEKEYLDIFRNVGLGTTIWSPLATGHLPLRTAIDTPRHMH